MPSTPASSKRVYLIPGLGADARLFRDLELPGCDVTILEWLLAQPNESFEHYIDRLVEPVDWSSNPVIAGVSFGGMATVNICQRYPARKGIIISSIKTHHELPLLLRIITRGRLHALLPLWMMRRRSGLVNWYFGVTTTLTKDLLHEILKGSDPPFTRWALTQIGRWRNTEIPEGLTHIHGTADRVFPIGRIRDCIKVPDGHHFMVADRANEISALLMDAINTSYL